ncbi:MATE family efflux transporter [Jannaschia seohaensis]|uniref:Multidrug-efflux transporter n=1 Tax=Jannaschia seohaensis TaxID=475081 RepID=A0A2Y9AQU6_9RHOB|nr:MATE family efflux transporter [Jannaschia seohaensis]PWJ18326.1 MATE family multidrug resistance protein [Jannaschia seohaensis]SSA46851.1 multidrug resistance protein, MATE family [Jannaschia seohaensis]
MRLAHDIKRTLFLGLPLVGGQVVQFSIAMTDTLMLGWYSVPALAAGTIGASFLFSILVLGAGFAFAVLPLASEAAGREDATAIRRATRMGLWLSAIYGIATLPVFLLSEPILRALGQQPQVASDARAYLAIVGLSVLPGLVTMVLRSHLSALERTRIVFWATVAGAGLNVFVNWLLIFGNWGFPEMGVAGAAVASVAVNLLMAGVLLVYAVRGPGMAEYALLQNLHRPDWEIFAKVFRIGWPIGLTHLSESGLFAASAVMMGWLGTVPLAAHGVAIQVAGLVFMLHLGLSQTVTVRVGQAWGRSDRPGVIRAAVAATILSGAAVVMATALYFGAGSWIVSLFVAPEDPAAPQILALGAHLLMLAALFQLVDAGQIMALGMLRGLQDTRVPMIYAMVGYWLLGVPASYLLGFPLGLGPDGVWLGLCVGLAAVAGALALRFTRMVSVPEAPVPG